MMLTAKRAQGRPPRDSGINGRDKLVEATRVYLQTNRKMSLTRSEIAHGCGVTPALISYYFKDKRSLLEAAIKPLLRSYMSKLHAIVDAVARLEDRTRGAVRLMIDLSTEDAFLIDYMLSGYASDKLDAEDRKVLEDVHRAIGGLVTELIESGRWRASDPLLTEVALWGVCKAFGETLRLKISGPDAHHLRAELAGTAVDYVCDTFATDQPAFAPSLATASA